jgi:hypothetical protein
MERNATTRLITALRESGIYRSRNRAAATAAVVELQVCLLDEPKPASQDLTNEIPT